MNLFAISSITCAVLCAIVAIIATIYGRSLIHRILIFFNVSVSIWAFGCFLVGIANFEDKAIQGWRIAHVGGVFVSTFFYHLVYLFVKVKRRGLLTFAYIQSVLLLILNLLFNTLITTTRNVYGLYYNEANMTYYFGVICYNFLI